MTLTFPDEEKVRKIVREEVRDEVKTQLTDFRSDMTTKLDKIIGLMQKRDQEVEVLSKQSSDHEDRFETIEQKLNIAY